MRFDIPAGYDYWDEFVSTNKVMDWADVPESGNNPSKEKYYEIFPTGPEPDCLIWIYGYGSYSRYIWVRRYTLGNETSKVLYVEGRDESGNEVELDSPQPAYGAYPDAGDALPLLYSAPEFARDGNSVEYKCIGYRIEKLNEKNQWVVE